MWSVWQPDRNLHFNSFFVQSREGGNLAVDPLPLDADGVAEIEAAGGLEFVVITNRDHERNARPLAAAFGAKLAASALDAPLLSAPVDRILGAGERLLDTVVVPLEGLKTAGEIALHLPGREAVIVGDSLWGDPAGSLRLMPDAKLADPARAASRCGGSRRCGRSICWSATAPASSATRRACSGNVWKPATTSTSTRSTSMKRSGSARRPRTRAPRMWDRGPISTSRSAPRSSGIASLACRSATSSARCTGTRPKRNCSSCSRAIRRS